MDVPDVLPTIRVPTLVLHKRDDQVVPPEEVKYIADRIPGAKFVELPGADHWPWIGHEQAVEEIQEFLTGMRDSAEPDRAVATVMFVDIVDSTKRAAELGDRRWANLLESFYAVVRRELTPRTRDRYGWRRVLRDLRRTSARHPMRDGTHGGCWEARAPHPDWHPYWRVRTDSRQGGWPRGRHWSTRWCAGWAWGDPRLADRAGPCCWLGSFVRRRRRAPEPRLVPQDDRVTLVTNVRLVCDATRPVTSQQPTVGNVTAVDWKPVNP